MLDQENFNATDVLSIAQLVLQSLFARAIHITIAIDRTTHITIDIGHSTHITIAIGRFRFLFPFLALITHSLQLNIYNNH